MQQIVLHACCAVCAGYPLQLLSENGFVPTVYFFNPNIYPKYEHDRRLAELIRYCDKMNYKLIIENDDENDWYNCIKGLEKEPERGKRCQKCFEFRLLQTAKKAKELNIEKFTTTLFISPHKIRQDIISAGIFAAKKYNLTFVDTDFRKKNGFLKTMQIAKSENFYRQNYCGCVFAKEEQEKKKQLLQTT